MKIQDLYENENKSDEEIMDLLKKYFGIGPDGVTINNGKVDVNNDVVIKPKIKFNELPVEFGKVSGYFDLDSVGLTTLKGCPSFGSHTLSVNDNKLTSLEFGPEVVIYDYYAYDNPITTLKYLPKQCKSFYIDYHYNLELLRLFYIDGLLEIGLIDSGALHPAAHIINSILDNTALNKQQKILLAKRELIKDGYESNARL